MIGKGADRSRRLTQPQIAVDFSKLSPPSYSETVSDNELRGGQFVEGSFLLRGDDPDGATGGSSSQKRKFGLSTKLSHLRKPLRIHGQDFNNSSR